MTNATSTSTPAAGSFVVLKFGGTSVSTAANWRNIRDVLKERLAEGVRPVVVHSALSGITDRLEGLLAGALAGDHGTVLAQIESRHAQLAADLGIALPEGVKRHLEDLRQIAAGVALVKEVSDRIRARVMSTGELMATELGAAWLNTQGLDVEWVDARSVLRAEERKGASEKASILSATCDFAPDAALRARFSHPGRVYLSQGFIAADDAGNTVLLGRGGSDTSGSYFAAKLQASRLEIWTDVPGMFSANPKGTPNARLLKQLHYDEAQEIASSGAKVLHPRCILPVKQYSIPLYVYATQTPKLEGTVITATPADGNTAQVKAIAIKKGITLVSMDSPGMWHEVGFLADVFQVFKAHGLSVDLVSTSETNVTVSLDPAANTLDARAVDALLASLAERCRAQVIGPCAALSLVGRNIRGILHDLGSAFALFEEQRVYLVSQAANDLNFTFVIDEEQGDRLVSQLHELLIRATANDRVLGPTWEQLYAPPQKPAAEAPWWQRRRAELLDTLAARDCAYVYDAATVETCAAQLKALRSIDRVHYAMKANPFPPLLKTLHAAGIGFECVSRGEVEHVLAHVPGVSRAEILYTPNFAPRAEYEWALGAGLQVTLDNLHPLREWASLFRGRDLFVRIDTGQGHGHHKHVRTGGVHQKFGVPVFEVEELARLARDAGARIVGVHAHMGSGNFAVDNWVQVAEVLAEVAAHFPDVRTIDVGGGLGVPEKTSRAPVDLALYGAYHEIVNLTRLDEAPTQTYEIVGPICESADVLGHDRQLPPTAEGDVLLVATAGAYGHAMSSRYNLREPAEELLLR
jgi:diaminopimelate decarboxylase/aspartate kinase